MSGEKRLLDFDPLSGVSLIFQYDDHERTMTLTHEQDVSQYVREAAILRQDTDRTKFGIKKDMVHYARVPIGIQYEWLTKYGVNMHNKDHKAKVFELLNGEYKAFKTTDIVHNVKNG